jgi:ATPase subunit of ABC transporter with duplicated ATPase domains
MDPHILVLDEPTNHLDIESINGLIDCINNFEGGVVIVSHDMELITQTDCVLWVCENKKIKKFNGDYNNYRDQILASV